jgi:endonuclease III
MTKQQIALAAVQALKEEYPDARCSLSYRTPLQLLIATRLSAQCTDARVNLVTPALFERFPDADSFASAQAEEVAEYIKSCGLYKTKSRDIVAMAQMLRDDFGGEVPDTIEQLTTLPGVGRKTANLICGDVFGNVNFGSNYAIMFTGFTASSYVGPLAAAFAFENTGSYLASYFIAAALAGLAIALVLLARRLEKGLDAA